MSFFAYVRQIMAHRRRMRRGAFMFFWNAPTRILGLVHDAEKALFLPVLFYYRGGRRNRANARRWYDAMNTVGSWIAAVALWLVSATKEERHRALLNERLLDCVDRHMDPVAKKELGPDAERPLSDFLPEEEIDRATELGLFAGWPWDA